MTLNIGRLQRLGSALVRRGNAAGIAVLQRFIEDANDAEIGAIHEQGGTGRDELLSDREDQ